MADHGIGFDAVRAPQLGQRDHDRPGGRLDDVHADRGRRGRVAAQQVGELPPDVGGERGLALLDAGGEGGRGVEQLAQPARGDGGLPGEGEDDPGIDGGNADRDPGSGAGRGLGRCAGCRLVRDERCGAGFGGGDGSQAGQQVGAVAADHDGALLEPGPGAGQRPRHRVGRQVGGGLQVFGELGGLCGERLRGAP